MKKHGTLNNGARAHCCYCKRDLTPANPETSTSFTLDHVKCLASGGWKRVPCCRRCNQLKDDLHMDAWFWFIAAHPRYWKQFTLPSQVKRVVMEERFNRVTGRSYGV